jgi:hypothetical protein
MVLIPQQGNGREENDLTNSAVQNSGSLTTSGRFHFLCFVISVSENHRIFMLTIDVVFVLTIDAVLC